MDKSEILSALKEQANSCTQCPLNGAGYDPGNLVFGVGSPNAPIMLIGEGPGEVEAQYGSPFIGPAGQILQTILRELNAMGNETLYLTNTVKHRAPNNRNPRILERRKCSYFLGMEIKVVKPQRIICLGRVAGETILGMAKLPIPKGSIRGHSFEYNSIPVHITWHPASVLYDPTGPKRDELKRDILNIMGEMHGPSTTIG